MTPPESKPKRTRAYQKSGMYGARRALREAGIKAVDRRTKLGRALREAGAELADHLGTEPSVTQARSIEAVLVCDVLVSAGMVAIEELGPVDRRKRTFRPIVRDLLAIMAQRRALCADLGWKRAARETPTLAGYLAAREARLTAEAAEKAATPAPAEPAEAVEPAPDPVSEAVEPVPEDPPVVFETPADRLMRGWTPKTEPPSEPDEGAGAGIEGEDPCEAKA